MSVTGYRQDQADTQEWQRNPFIAIKFESISIWIQPPNPIAMKLRPILWLLFYGFIHEASEDFHRNSFEVVAHWAKRYAFAVGIHARNEESNIRINNDKKNPTE